MGTWEEEWLDMTKDMQGSVVDYTKPEAIGDLSYLSNNNFAGLYEADQKIAGWIENNAVPVSPIPITPSTSSTSSASYGGESFLRAGSTSSSNTPVKIATPQYVDDLNKVIISEDADFLKMLYFEQINGVMLLSLTNSANLNTENINYQPIINMAETQKALDPKSVLALQNTSEKYFLNFPIRLETKIPNVGNGPSGTNVYLDSNGNLVIESINLGPGENIEIQTLQNGTIYETDLGVDES
jgi:predicted nuclease of predicted toxin-antitoxin system